MVTIPFASVIDAFDGFERTILKFSSNSSRVSANINTDTVLLVSPGLNTSVFEYEV